MHTDTITLPSNMQLRRAIIRRFWPKVDRSGGPDACWPWTATASRYGYFYFDPELEMVGAHRMAFTLCNGLLDEGDCILHVCDNPLCCNPRHLVRGSQLDNIQDRNQKARQSRGSAHAKAKVSEADVVQMRKLRAVNGWTYQRIAERYNLNNATAWRAINGKHWRHVLMPSDFPVS
jgi:hypothetical protein